MVRSIFQRLTGRREDRLDYESLLPDKNSLSAISEEDLTAEISYGSSSGRYGILLALHTATARARREWLFFDATGTARFQDVSMIRCGKDSLMIHNVSHSALLSVHVAVTSCAVIQVNKHELVAHLGIPFRDLRILDPSVRPHHVEPHSCQI